MRLCALILCISISLSSVLLTATAQSLPEFELPILVSDGVSDIDLTIGMLEVATNGKDRRIDRSIPPRSPGDFLRTYITGGGGDFLKDYRAISTDTTQYRIKVDPSDLESRPLTISWDSTLDLSSLGSFQIWGEDFNGVRSSEMDMTMSTGLDTVTTVEMTMTFVVEVIRSTSGTSTIELIASEDTYIRGSGAYDDVNFNGQDSLHVQNGTTNSLRYFSYLKFDLSSVTDSIQSAIVTLHPYAVSGSPLHDVALTTEPWSDSVLTWVDRPTVSDTIMTWTPVRGAPVSLDLTAEAQAAWQETGQTLEIRLGSNYSPSSDTGWAIYSAEESDTTANRPIIAITTPDDGTPNQPPSVSITEPANLATFNQGDTIVFKANATDTDGTVNQVEYFLGGTSLGVSTESDFSLSWDAMVAGNYYNITAVATDNDGASTTSEGILIIVNEGSGESTIELVASEDTYIRGSGAYDDVNFNGQDSLHVQNGTTNSLRYFSYLKFDLTSITDSIESAIVTLHPYAVSGSPLHDVALTTEPWSDSVLTWVDRPTVSDTIMTWTPVRGAPVSLDLTAEAQAAWQETGQTLEIRLGSNYSPSSDTDWAIYSAEESDTTANRPVIEITTVGGGTANQPPTVSITAPVDGTTYTEGDTIALQVSTTDTDGTVDQVEYFASGTSIGISSEADFSLDWSGMAAGNYSIVAVATDNDDASTTSDSINVIVNSSSGGSTIDLVASEDTYIRGSGAYDDVNFNGQDSLHVQNGTTNSLRYFSYLKFDLSSITDSIESAIVTLYPYAVSGSPLHDVALTTEAWSDSVLTWVDRPTVSDTIMTWTPVRGVPVSLDLTAEAQAAWQETDQTLEIRLGSNYSPSSDTDWAIYSAEESDSTANRPIISITTTSTGGSKRPVSIQDWDEVPHTFTLRGNYPNPFNPTTTIVFDLHEDAEVSVEVFDLMGRMLKKLPSSRMTAGQSREIHLDAYELASGMYLYKIEAVSQNLTRSVIGRMVLLK